MTCFRFHTRHYNNKAGSRAGAKRRPLHKSKQVQQENMSDSGDLTSVRYVRTVKCVVTAVTGSTVQPNFLASNSEANVSHRANAVTPLP
ncbi:hypothetical protein ABVT39_013603 [Epinephelus coioides]